MAHRDEVKYSIWNKFNVFDQKGGKSIKSLVDIEREGFLDTRRMVAFCIYIKCTQTPNFCQKMSEKNEVKDANPP